jgi:wobble nucleotide-excising tRNase
MIQQYRAYFSDEYAALKRQLADLVVAVNRSHGDDVPAAFERAVRVAVDRRQYWSRFCHVEAFALDTAVVGRDWRAAREAVVAQLTGKQAAPLERVAVSAATRAFVASYEAHRNTIATINQTLLEANRAVRVAKERAAAGNSSTLASDLARLKAVKARYEPATATRCDEYLRERAGKEATEQQRDEARAALEAYRTQVFPGYQTAINLYLARFAADFRLDSVTYANTRGGPTCSYNVLINNSPVLVGGADPAPGQPSFRNTLSAGDRNTLVLAFFFASLDQDPRLANKVVVVDDPISSLDEHRTFTTVQEIRRLAERASQVIVLSHNKPFLCRLWEGADDNTRAAFEVVRDAVGPLCALGKWRRTP